MSLANNLDLNQRLSRLSPEKRAQLALQLSKAGQRGGSEKTVALPNSSRTCKIASKLLR